MSQEQLKMKMETLEELEQRLAEVNKKKNIAVRAMEYENAARLREEERTLLKLIEEKQSNKQI